MAEELSFLENLPLEMQCKILSGPLTLQQYLTTRLISPDVENVVNNCLTSLISEDDQGFLSPELILSLKRIQVISPEYPIRITQERHLFELAQHPTLVEASFDLTLLQPYERIFTLVTKFFDKYHTLGNECQDCRGRYSFGFFIIRNGKKQDIIQVTEGHLLTSNLQDYSIEGIPLFYRQLGINVPVCEYIADLNYSLVGIQGLLCLSRLSLILEVKFIRESTKEIGKYFERTFVTSVMVPQITEYTISYPKETSYYRDFFNRVIRLIELRKLVYPQVTSFLPFPFGSNTYAINSIKRAFPNLTTIHLILPSMTGVIRIGTRVYSKIARDFLMNYQKIVLVNDKNKTPDQKFYLGLFPEELWPRITFTESNWAK